MKQFRRAVLSGSFLALAAICLGQAPEPYKFIPADAKAAVQINFAAAEKSQRLGPIVATIKEAEPGFPESFIFENEPTLSILANGFPGKIAVMESAMENLGTMNPVDSRAYVVFRGTFDPAKLVEKLKGAGWTDTGKIASLTAFKDPTGTSFMTMADANTLLVANSAENLQQMIETGTGQTPGVTKSQSNLSKMLAAAGPGFVSGAAELTPQMRQMLSQQAQQGAQQMAMIPGYMQVAAQAGLLNTAGFSLAEGSAVNTSILLNFDSEEAAQQAGGGLNLLLPMAINMAAGQIAAQDPTASQTWLPEVQKLATYQFKANGTITAINYPIPDRALAAIKESAADAVSSSPKNLMPLPPQQ